MTIITQTLKEGKPEERWFVYDWENNLQIFTTETAAYDEYHKQIDLYREEAQGDEWCDEVEWVTWGKVFQTTKLIDVESPRFGTEDYNPSIDDNLAEAFAIEHRKEVSTE
jgi:hypothetical protein